VFNAILKEVSGLIKKSPSKLFDAMMLDKNAVT